MMTATEYAAICGLIGSCLWMGLFLFWVVALWVEYRRYRR